MPSSKTHVVFDVDGVIVDSHAAVRAAYKLVGVEMPDDAWGKPWHVWLPQLVGSTFEAEDLHGKKNYVYTAMLRDGQVRPLAGASVAHRLAPAQRSFLTGASAQAARAALRAAGLPRGRLWSGCTAEDKAARLLRLAGRGVYVDDDPAAGKSITAAAGWCFVKFVDNEDQLMEDVRQWMQ